MTRNNWACALLVFLLICAGMGFGYLWVEDPGAYAVYDDVMVFKSEESYQGFKEFIVENRDIQIKDLSILASEPFIVVKFDIETDIDYDFPYGHKSIEASFKYGLGGKVVFGLLCLLAVSVSFLPSLFLYKEEAS